MTLDNDEYLKIFTFLGMLIGNIIKYVNMHPQKYVPL